jgi:hypothetical protein
VHLATGDAVAHTRATLLPGAMDLRVFRHLALGHAAAPRALGGPRGGAARTGGGPP